MGTSTSSVNITRRKVLSAICLIVFCLAFIFSCLYKVLPLGRYIVGTFGIMTYPLLILLTLVSLASFLGFSYARSTKATMYFCVALASVLLFIHSLATFKQLNLVIGWKTFTKYLAYSYTTKVTLVGSVGSILCGIISIFLGAMGSIIIFVITGTLFIGLFIDYHYYGKYEKPHVKKLKTRVIREKVQKSDKKKTKDQKPVYSFTEESSSCGCDVVGEITVDASEVDNSGTVYDTSYTYSQNDVVGEITDEAYAEAQQYGSLNSGYSSGFAQEDIQSHETFSDEGFYQEPEYPSIFSESKDNEHRKKFMSDTFGGYSTNDSPLNYGEDLQTYGSENLGGFSQTYNNSVENTNIVSDSPSLGGFENIDADLTVDHANEIDEISKILGSTEDDIENDVKSDIFGETFGNSTSYGQELTPAKTQETSLTSYGDSFKLGYGEVSDKQEKNLNIDRSFESKNAGFGTNVNTTFGGYSKPEPVIETQKPQVKVTSTHPFMGSEPAPAVVVPPKTSSPNPYGFNMSMPGVRYNPPPLSLLKTPKPDNGDYTAEQNRKTAQLEQVLAAFNVPAKVKNIVRGPKITRYELSVPLGVSVKKIPNYEDDIAAALAAKTIVIKAPIPGSPYVGIELENDTFTSVFERELLESDAFQNFKDPLPIAIGKDISGEIVIKSLAKMVHLLIAGSTGSGKSVFMHNIILSLIYKSSPDNLRLIMIDPKKVEFNRYNGIPHLLTPEVVAGSEKAINAFKWCVKEMERRYDLMSKAGYNNIEPYNKSELVKAGQFEKFPYIVIVVDELAEIMAVNKKDVELCIQRLTQLARACGMHLIVATQRPSVDIITGVIKNNIPSRIAFSLQSGIDSKTILNSVGAEKLLGQGDMIFSPTGTSAMPRLQGAYATDDEIKAVIDYVKKNNTANFDETVNNIINSEQPATVDEVGGGAGFADAPPPRDSVDSYFKTAVKLVMANGGASVSYLQRRLSIGYSRAARIIDQMEDKGYIAPTTGSKLRKVLITPEQFREDFGEEYDSLND